MTYTALQTTLDYAAIAPFLIAVGLLVSHLVNCWERSQSQQTPLTDELIEAYQIAVGAPPNIPVPKLKLWQQTPIGKIVGIIWDSEDSEWCYIRDLSEFETRSERWFLREMERHQ